MEKTKFKQYMILAALFAATWIAVGVWGAPARLAGPRVSLELPARVGAWRGHAMFYCQDETCLASFVDRGQTATDACPVCGAELDTAALGERRLLPEDTVIRHRMYENSSGRSIAVSVVVSGSGRASIHRPEWCLPGQGYGIVSSRVIDVPMPDREAVPASLLALRSERSPRGAAREAMYLYWFVGARREVARHTERLFWMAWQNLVHNTRYRWAYVAVAMEGAAESPYDQARLMDFVGEFYARIDTGSP